MSKTKSLRDQFPSVIDRAYIQLKRQPPKKSGEDQALANPVSASKS